MTEEPILTETDVREQLHQLINVISEKKLRALYQLLKEEEVEEYEWWKDEEFVAELERRSEALENGTDKGITLEEFREHYKLKFLENIK
jgi:hypothetical protein